MRERTRNVIFVVIAAAFLFGLIATSVRYEEQPVIVTCKDIKVKEPVNQSVVETIIVEIPKEHRWSSEKKRYIGKVVEIRIFTLRHIIVFENGFSITIGSSKFNEWEIGTIYQITTKSRCKRCSSKMIDVQKMQ
jgi:hypothetical protein